MRHRSLSKLSNEPEFATTAACASLSPPVLTADRILSHQAVHTLSFLGTNAVFDNTIAAPFESHAPMPQVMVKQDFAASFSQQYESISDTPKFPKTTTLELQSNEKSDASDLSSASEGRLSSKFSPRPRLTLRQQ